MVSGDFCGFRASLSGLRVFCGFGFRWLFFNGILGLRVCMSA